MKIKQRRKSKETKQEQKQYFCLYLNPKSRSLCEIAVFSRLCFQFACFAEWRVPGEECQIQLHYANSLYKSSELRAQAATVCGQGRGLTAVLSLNRFYTPNKKQLVMQFETGPYSADSNHPRRAAGYMGSRGSAPVSSLRYHITVYPARTACNASIAQFMQWSTD